ncbi:hypothetical protein [Ensifer sp. LBL]|uniref:hypothetical protein n=1 Tax=Ensifer sp. LBL TaxID=2991056 RepID=UPI003D23026B
MRDRHAYRRLTLSSAAPNRRDCVTRRKAKPTFPNEDPLMFNLWQLLCAAGIDSISAAIPGTMTQNRGKIEGTKSPLFQGFDEVFTDAQN